MIKKTLCMIMTAAFVFTGLTACGSNTNTSRTEDQSTSTEPKNDVSSSTGQNNTAATEQSNTQQNNAQGSVQGWGNWTVYVPAGFELEGGDFLDETDTRYFSVKKSDFSFFDFKADSEENIMSHYNYNKETYTNEQEDVKGTYGSIDWDGFQYSDGFGGYGFEAYARVDGTLIRVSSAGYKFDSEESKTILGSLKYDAAGASAAESADADSV